MTARLRCVPTSVSRSRRTWKKESKYHLPKSSVGVDMPMFPIVNRHRAGEVFKKSVDFTYRARQGLRCPASSVRVSVYVKIQSRFEGSSHREKTPQ
jgi:hypothetical protein